MTPTLPLSGPTYDANELTPKKERLDAHQGQFQTVIKPPNPSLQNHRENPIRSCSEIERLQYIGVCAPTEGYYGGTNEAADIEARVAKITAALESAHAKADNDPSCLKILMTPEFFFRGTDKGAYTLEGAQQLTHELQSLVSDDKYENWLFVFGTIAAFSEPALPSEFPDETIYEVYNYALVLEGGSETDPINQARIVMKKRKSDADYEYGDHHRNALLNTDNTTTMALMENLFDECPDKPYDGQPIFEIPKSIKGEPERKLLAGVTICQDHHYPLLDSQHPNPVDMLLIPSSGLIPDEVFNNGLSENGLRMYNDGFVEDTHLFDNKTHQIIKPDVYSLDQADTTLHVYPAMAIPEQDTITPSAWTIEANQWDFDRLLQIQARCLDIGLTELADYAGDYLASFISYDFDVMFSEMEDACKWLAHLAVIIRHSEIDLESNADIDYLTQSFPGFDCIEYNGSQLVESLQMHNKRYPGFPFRNTEISTLTNLFMNNA